jgi:hypothetical protein
MAAATGLWDAAANKYLVPQAASTATTPGGAGGLTNPAAFFNVAFRSAEPSPVMGATGLVQTGDDPAWWRDRAQAVALTAGDISNLYAAVDFGKLVHRVTDESNVPQTGAMDRILASHFEPAQGINYGSSKVRFTAPDGTRRRRLHSEPPEPN